MGKMKNKAILYVFMVVVGCYLIPESGTLGSGASYEFNCSDDELNKCLDSMEKKDTTFRIPRKWEKYNDWEQTGYDFLKGKVFYMKENKAKNFREEMYYVSVSQNNKSTKNLDSLKKNVQKKTHTYLRSIFRMVENKPRWLYCDSIDNDEMGIIEKRFQKSILDKVTKSDCGCTQYELRD